MRPTFRSLLLGSSLLLATLAQAQGEVYVTGTVENCTPGQTVSIQLYGNNGFWQQNATTVTNEDCSYQALFTGTIQQGVVIVQTTCANGVNSMDSSGFSLPMGMDSVWVNLSCGGTPTCNADFTVYQAGGGGMIVPWQIYLDNETTSSGPLNYLWTLPNGAYSTEYSPDYTFNQPGVYGICLNIWNADSSCYDWHCDTVVVDSSGMVSTDTVWYDCQNVLWGPSVPGTPCDDGDPMTSNTIWDANCMCTGDTTSTACNACISIDQSTPYTAVFTHCGGDQTSDIQWDFSDAGVVQGDTVEHTFPGPGSYTACLTVFTTFGTSCQSCDTLTVDADGNITTGSPIPPCEAGFWAIQAYDSTAGGVEPIPNEVWVWNLSSGGTGTYQFTWDFGDGTSSTEAFPTHVYDGPGPWLLCLTMVSGDPLEGGCTDTYCDSISVDENGLLNGMAPQGGHPGTQMASDRTGGFTLNVIQSVPTGITALPALDELALWPNPVNDELNLSFRSSLTGTVPVTVVDPSGRVLISGTHAITGGTNQLHLRMDALDAGLYMVRVGEGAASVTQRFLKMQ